MIEYIFTGPFGIISMTFKYLICILTPLVSVFTFLQLCLEKSGLLLFLEYKLRKPLNRLGLSSQSLLPLITGFGCTTAALSSLNSTYPSRERYIVSFLLSVAVPCSAQVAIIIGIAFVLPPFLFCFYIATVMLVFTSSGIILNLILPESKFYHIKCPESSTTHLPDIKKLFKSSILYGFSFLKETIIPFITGSVIMSVLNYFGTLDYMCRAVAPLTENFLHLPKESAALFVMSIAKRDFGAAGLLSMIDENTFSDVQITIAMIILTLFVPCFASMIIILKQEKLLKSLSIWAGSLLISISVGKLASILLL